MDWLLLTLLSVLVASVANILLKVLMSKDKSDPYLYAIIFHIVLGILNLCFALFYGSQFSLFSGNFLVLLLASALWAGCSIFLFKALQLLESSEISIVSMFRIVVAIVASVIFLQEVFDIQKAIGAVIIIVSTLLVVNLKNGFVLNKGLLYTVAMSVFAGLATIADSINVQHYDVIAYNTITNFLIAFIIVALYPTALKGWKQVVQLDFLKRLLPLGILSTIQSILYLQALTHVGYTAQIATIRQATVIVTVLLAVVFLNERDNLWSKLAAAIAVTIGVVLLG